MNNCTWENKNRFQFGFLECFIAWKEFDGIQFSILTIGHTHEDIEQAFPSTFQRLKSNNVTKRTELQKQFGFWSQ